jgi:hypothetical protein
MDFYQLDIVTAARAAAAQSENLMGRLIKTKMD